MNPGSRKHPPGLTTQHKPLPGTRASCALLTVLTVLLAWPDQTRVLRVVVVPAYFALLVWFFWVTSRGRDPAAGQPMKLIRWGFLVLWLGFTTSATIHFTADYNLPGGGREAAVDVTVSLVDEHDYPGTATVRASIT